MAPVAVTFDPSAMPMVELVTAPVKKNPVAMALGFATDTVDPSLMQRLELVKAEK